MISNTFSEIVENETKRDDMISDTFLETANNEITGKDMISDLLQQISEKVPQKYERSSNDSSDNNGSISFSPRKSTNCWGTFKIDILLNNWHVTPFYFVTYSYRGSWGDMTECITYPMYDNINEIVAKESAEKIKYKMR